MPQISELYVALGVKGSAQTIEALSNVRLNIGSISTAALTAQAAILGMAYALQQLTTGATNNAQNIQNLSTYLDMSTKSLQQWHWAAQQAGISNQELDQSFTSIKNHINEYASKHNLPQGSEIFAQHTGFDFTKPFKADDLMRAAIDFAKDQTLPQSVKESILQSWGITPNEISQAMLGRFNTGNLARAPVLSNGEINTLSDMGVQFDNLETKIKMFFSHFSAAHATEIVKTITDMTNALLSLATVLDQIATKLHVFQGLDLLFKSITTGAHFASDLLNGKRNTGNKLENWIFSEDEQKQLVDSIKQSYELQNRLDSTPDIFKSFLGQSGNNLLSGYGEFKKDMMSLFNINPSSSLPNRYSLSPNNNPTNINQNLYFQHSGTDHAMNQESHRYAIAQAYRMSSANSRAT